ncbi:MAG: biopolymer transporter ExbD [gamma proteobacterium symbiont of Bathyaustriella thionipta]|nr:biopolymer transporter ExbD [gamma proteobacterium symbiont of Bathyaustriella thionipta]MCU7948728.1 biopolymer transporter ExbD [gamma proteobacterium symbiont of Bathyaustriella thionipta]MCU7954631.1 biopolymer transporter ExbD [gamma proteobacterium symbiont of Bathyaustriella thionipta]MCU7955211.1 biopolymer transporter ExbD [gamma proteobacterium symbiont of Bathyaustriella thionipta]MCU7968241.1 biopolymer transporter ExbD [gamma proteobacterium symbiont of Bathyaustriella thionipta
MQFEGRRRTSNVPNLTPLIDIVFLLLVFFMLTSHFVRDEVLNIDLPEADSGEALDEPQQIEIIINEAGEYLINSQIATLETLESLLIEALKEQKEKVVRIRSDENVDLGIAIGAFDAARKAGASGVDIVTIDHPATSTPPPIVLPDSSNN